MLSINQLNEFVEIIAKWLEVLGFILGVITAIKVFLLDDRVKTIQSNHLFQSRISEHLKELKQTSSAIANLFNAFSNNIKPLRIEVTQCHQNCLSIKKKTKGYALSNLEKLIKVSKEIVDNKYDINKVPTRFDKIFHTCPLSEKDFDKFYETLTSLISETEQLLKDIKKSTT